MTQVAWPRNIVPYTEDALRALSTVPSVALYERALDRPLVERDLSAEERPVAAELIAAGLLARRDGVLAPTMRHRREPEGGARFSAEHKLAVVGHTEEVLADTARALRARGSAAQAALGVVRLPERPDVVARAVAIMAEAEDQLRALAEEETMTPDAPEMRVIVFLGSAR